LKSISIYRVLAAFVWFGLLLVWPQVGKAEGVEITLEEYRREVYYSLKLVNVLEGNPIDEISPRLEEKAALWESISAVVLHDGEIIPVDTSYLVALFRAEEPDLSVIAAHLSALQSLDQLWPDRVYDGDDVAEVEFILAQPEFQWAEPTPNPLNDLIERFLNWLDEWFDKLFPQGLGGDGEGGGGEGNLSWLYYLLSFIFIGFLFYYIFRGAFSSLVSEVEIEEGFGEDTYLTADKAVAEAQTLSRRGDHRKAVRYLYLSALLYLQEKGVLHYDTTKTNREYLQSVAEQKPLSRSLGKVVETFDKVWYGFREIDEDAYADYEEEVESLRKQK